MRDFFTKIKLFKHNSGHSSAQYQGCFDTAGTTASRRTVKAATLTTEVPYVPSSGSVILEMLRLTDLRKEDVLYDLGCGDGRIVIAAAEKTEVSKCVGVDSDPQRISQCRENARKADVDGRVLFLQGDIFTVDFSEASVLTLYLLTSANLRLRSRILAKTKPGTRVVSHDFDMGDWKPDRTSYINGTMHKVYYWIVPANVSGRWQFRSGMGNSSLQISQRFQQAGGVMIQNGNAAVLRDVHLNGNKLSFSSELMREQKRIRIQCEGTVNGDRVRGNMLFDHEGREKMIEFDANRKALTRLRIDVPEEPVVQKLLH